MTRKKAYVLINNYSHFGRKIPKGTVYRESKKNKDWYIPNVFELGILMTCPNIQLHFTTLHHNDLFIEIYD